DPLPATDRRPVEAETLVERRFVEGSDRKSHVLPGPEQVAELEIDHLRGRLARPFERLAGVRRGRLTVRQVVLRLFRCHATPSTRDHKKRAQDFASPEAPLPRRPPTPADDLRRTLVAAPDGRQALLDTGATVCDGMKLFFG